MIRAVSLGVRLTLSALLLGACAQLAWAQAPKTVFLEELTWTELRDQVQAGKTTVIDALTGFVDATGSVAVAGQRLDGSGI